jgi:hypothetical protein
MVAEDGILLIAMKAELYQLETEMMKVWIEEKATFSEYSDYLKNNVIADDEDYSIFCTVSSLRVSEFSDDFLDFRFTWQSDLVLGDKDFFFQAV